MTARPTYQALLENSDGHSQEAQHWRCSATRCAQVGTGISELPVFVICARWQQTRKEQMLFPSFPSNPHILSEREPM